MHLLVSSAALPNICHYVSKPVREPLPDSRMVDFEESQYICMVRCDNILHELPFMSGLYKACKFEPFHVPVDCSWGHSGIISESFLGRVRILEEVKQDIS